MKTCDEFTKAFSNQLRTLRMQKNLSARKMSLSLGQNVNYINLIENGKRMPSLQGVFAICGYLDVSVADFFEFTKDRIMEKEISNQQELQRMAKILTNEQAGAVVQLVGEFI